VFQLKEKRVVVTGTASGIGLAIAEIFAAHEAAVVVLPRPPQRSAKRRGHPPNNLNDVLIRQFMKAFQLI